MKDNKFIVSSNTYLGKELKELLSESVNSAKTRESTYFDELAGPFKDSLILFGAGSLGRKVLAGLRKEGIEPLAFSDSDPSKWGSYVDGVQVLSPSMAARKFGGKAAFIATTWNPYDNYLSIAFLLKDLNCQKVIPFPALAWKYPDIFLPHFFVDLPHRYIENSSAIIKTFNLVADIESRSQYLAQLRLRLLLDFNRLPDPATKNQYFPRDLILLSPEEVFIDCGAFDGDTLKRILELQGSKFKKIMAFEPDTLNFRKLGEYVLTLPSEIKSKINIFNLACCDKQKKLFFDPSGTEGSSVTTDGSIEVEGIPLDDILIREVPTFIKIDIEGSEMNALIGAQKVIRRVKPIIAISVYHKPFDLWELPLYIHSLYNEYQFFFRTHAENGFDTVIYAIPPNRILS